MDIPTFKIKKQQVNIRELLLTDKPIRKLRVAVYHANNINSWINDVLTLSRIYLRALEGRVFSPKLFRALNDWAEVAIDYGESYGITRGGNIVDSKLRKGNESTVFISKILAEILEYTPRDPGGSPIRLQVCQRWDNIHDKQIPSRTKTKCYITRRTPLRMVIYTHKIYDIDIKSSPTGSTTIQEIVRAVNRGVKLAKQNRDKVSGEINERRQTGRYEFPTAQQLINKLRG